MEANENEKIAIMLRTKIGKDERRSKGVPPEILDFDLIIAPAWREIRYCFECWLDWAVTLLCPAILEYAVKDVAWGLKNPGIQWDGKSRNKYFKETNVEGAIEMCFECKIINESQREMLRDICIKSRDLLSHMNAMNLSKGKVFPSMPMMSINTGIIVVRENVEALDNPFASKAAFWEKVNNLSTRFIVETYSLLITIYKDELKKYDEVLERRKRGDFSDGGAVIGSW